MACELNPPGFTHHSQLTLEESGWRAARVIVRRSEVIEAMEKLRGPRSLSTLETQTANCRL